MSPVKKVHKCIDVLDVTDKGNYYERQKAKVSGEVGPEAGTQPQELQETRRDPSLRQLREGQKAG